MTTIKHLYKYNSLIGTYGYSLIISICLLFLACTSSTDTRSFTSDDLIWFYSANSEFGLNSCPENKCSNISITSHNLDRAYLWTGDNRGFDTTPSKQDVILKPENRYKITIDVIKSDNIDLVFYILFYDSGKRVDKKRITLDVGRNVLDVKPPQYTQHARLAIRISGTGDANISSIKITKNKINPVLVKRDKFRDSYGNKNDYFFKAP